MKIPFVYRRSEGELLRQGINWTHDCSTKFSIAIYIWRALFYLRIRSDWLVAQGNRRVIWSIDWRRKLEMCGVKFDFDTRSIIVDKVHISLEFLEMLTNPRPNRYYRFERVGDFLHIEEKISYDEN